MVAAAPAPAPASKPVPAATAKPPPAPAAKAAAAAASTPPGVPSPPETVAQIGAFSTREAGERAWKRLSEAFPKEFTGRGIRIDQVRVNGATAYRTSVDGFASPTEADALCSRLMSASEACFVRKAP